MEIKFTKDQYDSLIKLVYLGNWMINSIRDGGKEIKKYDDVEQYIYSFAKEFGLDNLIEYDTQTKQYYPTWELDDNPEVEPYRQDYENEVFWDELTDRLARQDFVRHHGEKAIRKMSQKEHFEKLHPFIEKYEEEFYKHGIERLEIKNE
jgi:hypothetical protein